MSEEVQEKPKTLAELYPDFDSKYQELNQAYVNLWQAKKRNQDMTQAKEQAKRGMEWAKQVIESFVSLDEMKQKVDKDTQTYSLGLRLAKDELLLKQLYLTMEQIQGLL